MKKHLTQNASDTPLRYLLLQIRKASVVFIQAALLILAGLVPTSGAAGDCALLWASLTGGLVSSRGISSRHWARGGKRALPLETRPQDWGIAASPPFHQPKPVTSPGQTEASER